MVDFSAGAIIQTGRGLDVAVRDNGFIAVQAPDGSEAYTRAGDLRTTSAGILTTGAGYPVLGEGGPIALPPATQANQRSTRCRTRTCTAWTSATVCS